MSIVDTTEINFEVERVELWRLDTLERAGYDAESAAVLAASPEVDLHRAVSLARARLQRGSRAPDPPVAQARQTAGVSESRRVYSTADGDLRSPAP